MHVAQMIMSMWTTENKIRNEYLYKLVVDSIVNETKVNMLKQIELFFRREETIRLIKENYLEGKRERGRLKE